MTHPTRAWPRWLALATIVFATLWCCCDRADARPVQAAHACCAQKHAETPVSCPSGSSCAFVQLRSTLALPDAISQIAPPDLWAQVAFALHWTPAVWRASSCPLPTHHPPLVTLLDLHCSLLC